MQVQRKRIAALLLAGAMLFTTLPVNALAVENPDTGGLCEHHPEHTADCGYTEGAEGAPCGHEDTEDCYTLVTECVHEHTDECYLQESVSDNVATPPDADKAEPVCGHMCSEESSCIVKELDCQHEHDADCGYTEAVLGTSCTFGCKDCDAETGEQEDKCICDAPCIEEVVNTDCPICGVDGADLTACKGEAEPEQPQQITITALDPLDDDVANQIVTPGTDLNLPDTLGASGYVGTQDSGGAEHLTIEGVTWEPDRPYDENAEQGAWLFTAVLPEEGYTLLDGVELPEISVLAEPVNLLADNTPVKYINYYWDDDAQELVRDETETTEPYTLITKDNATTDWQAGWYVVRGDVPISNRITVTGKVHLILENECKLDAQQGINVGNGNSLTIYAQSEGGNMGILNANTNRSSGYAGIRCDSNGKITINGGKITANGGSGNDTINGGAGIGGNSRDTGGTIIITGGDITANGGANSSGIGHGYRGSDYKVIISGGTIKTSGILNGFGNTSGSTVDITGGYIESGSKILTATNKDDCMLIEDGNISVYGDYKLDADLTVAVGKTFSIGKNVTFTMTDGKKLVNHGTLYNNGIIENIGTIENTGTLGNHGTISGSETLTNSGTIYNDGTISDTSLQNSGTVYNSGDIPAISGTLNEIEAGTLMTDAGPLIFDDTCGGSCHHYIIGIEDTTANNITVESGKHDITINGINIDASSNFSENGTAFDIQPDAEVNLTLEGDNYLKSYQSNAGLQVPEGATLVITEESKGSLTVTTNSYDAGIGGGSGQSGGNITINGGNITIKGNTLGAGIGGGYGQDTNGGSITITGGNIVAKESNIGDGWNGGGGNVLITGGTVETNGIGISYGGTGSKITITGGTVVTTSAIDGTFSTTGADGEPGNAVIIAGDYTYSGPESAITDYNEDDWSGVIIIGQVKAGLVFENLTGKLYGDTVTPTEDFTIPTGATVTIDSGKTLVIDDGITMTVDGQIINNGVIKKYGEIKNKDHITVEPAQEHESNVTVIFQKQSSADPITEASYGDAITVVATMKKQENQTRMANAAQNQVVFSVDGKAVETATVTENNGVVTAKWGVTLTGDSWKASETGYTITADFGGGKTLFGSSGESTLKVNAADIKDMVSWIQANPVDYDGKLHQPVPIVQAGNTDLNPNTDYTVSYSRDNGQTETRNFTDAGDITVTVKGIGNYGGEVKKTFTIAPAALTLGATPGTASGKYGTSLGRLQIDGPEVTFDGKSVDGEWAFADAVKDQVLPVKEGGEGGYTLKATFKPEVNPNNYKLLTADIEVTISKAPAPTVNPVKKEYVWTVGSRGETQEVDIAALFTGEKPTGYSMQNTDTSSGIVENVDIDTDGKLTFTVKSGQVNATATMTVTATFQNYIDAKVEVKVKLIEQTQLNLSCTIDDEATYTGQPYNGLSNLSAADYDGEFDILYTGRKNTSYSSVTPPTGAGDYTVTITPADEAFSGKLEQDFIIKKATTTFETAITFSGDGDNRTAALTVTVKGVSDNDKPDGTITLAGDGLAEAKDLQLDDGTISHQWTSLKQGKYQVTITYSGDQNYSEEVETIGFDTSKKSQTIEITEIGAKAYGDEQFPLSLSEKGAGSGAVTYESSDPTILSIENQPNENTAIAIIHKVGTVTITATKAEDTEYNGARAEIQLEIGKATPTLTLTPSASELRGGGKVTLTLTGLPAGGTATVSCSDSSITVSGSGTSWTATLPNRTAAYTFTANYSGDAQHTSAEAACTVSVTKRTSGGGSSSGGGGGSSTITDRPDENDPDSPTTGQTQPVKPDKGGNVTINSGDVQDAINKATADANKNGNQKNGIAITVPVNNAADANSLTITIPAATLDKLVTAKVRQFDITTNGLPCFSFTLDTLKMLDRQSQGGDLILRLTKTAVTSAEAKAAIGTRPAYDITLVWVKNGKETPLTDWQGQTISVKLPYTPATGEQAGNLYAVSVDAAGKVEWLTKSSYDADQKAVLFEAAHFSVYGVGYKTPAPVFNDISGHWAEEHILFVASRGLLNGTGNSQFSPNTGMTRGMFVTALGRLAGIDPASYQSGKFNDVAVTAYYAPYVNWAAQTGIVNGTTDTTFSPDSRITREQMAVMMANYADKLGYELPATLEAVTFVDNASISSWSAEAVKAMQQAGILAGKDGNRFDPQGTATRAEVATVLHRFVEIVIDPQAANGWTENASGTRSYYKGGKPAIGWLYDEKWYWLQNGGVPFAGGWKQIGGKWYFFNPDGTMAVNTTIDGYTIGPDGARK
ncbi:hypothetical protein HMPREF1085_05393 [Enterocloster bolteae 90A9]|uniref:SLH domain-containing protein n=2 Tax=Enterocloster bolteae TaxID=208479 RepID=R0BRA0_9FIRM|nr:S-layer homology domain-containing protein [Enterocloster bolteae]ENZ39384.1 hypothetical protein HMPREF1089_04017 [Enterocloster bolteae 90B3]ENZ46802.1 hypothetical protein HMPREF1085_05393 [Enterocloster bolteae 90A9]